MIEISNYNSNSSTYGLYKRIISKIKLSSNTNDAQRESLFIKDICNRIEKSKTVLYVLELDKEVIGLISLSVTSIQDQPSMQIDYIFVSENYRGKSLEELDDLKPFKYLIEIAINLAKEIKTTVGLRYIVLSPDTDELKHKYEKVFFQELNKEWMYLKI